MTPERAIVVLPTFNEAENIAHLIQKVFEIVPDIFILVIDDNSPDGTGKIVDELVAKYENLRVIHREAKLGLGTAYQVGFRYAVDNGFDLVLEMDSDFSHDPEYIPELIALTKEYDVVLGSRYVPGGGTPDWELKRRLLSRGANMFARFMLDLNIRDSTAGFRCYRRSALEAIGFERVRSCGYAFQVEMLYRSVQKGLTICEHPILFLDRRFGTSKLGRQELVEGVKTLFRLRFEEFGRGRILGDQARAAPDKRRVLIPLLIVALVFGSVAYQQYRTRHALPAIEGPRLALSNEEIDFGEVYADEELKQVIEVTNIGSELLVINNLRASCSCVKTELLKKEIPPKESAELEVGLLLDHYPTNSVESKVYVHSNDPTSARHEIKVFAQVRPEYVIEPEELNFGRVKRGRSEVMSLLVRQTGREELILERVEAPAELSVSFGEIAPTRSNPAVQEGQVADKTYKVDVRIQPQVEVRMVNTSLTLVTNIERVPKFKVHVSARMVGIECITTPRVVAFGPSRPGDEVGRIEVTGVNDIEVLQASCNIEDIELQVEEIEPHKRYAVKLALEQDAEVGQKVGMVLLKLKEGELVETREVPVYGTVEKEDTAALGVKDMPESIREYS